MIGDDFEKFSELKNIDKIIELILPIIRKKNKSVIAISGESGAGKTFASFNIAKKLNSMNIKSIIISQDDYFIYPPKTNHQMREKDIKHVGISEINWKVLKDNIESFQNGKESIKKPLINFHENKILEEIIELTKISVLVLEGTYVNILENLDYKIFIDLNYLETRDRRIQRKREVIDDFIDKVLEIEHKIISSHKKFANIAINKNFEIEIISP